MMTQTRAKPGPVLRIRMVRTGDRWEVVKRIRLEEKMLPASDELPWPNKSGRIAGFWFEAVDEEQRCVYRQVLREPPRGVELFEDDGSITRVSAERDQYCVDVLVPDLPGVKEVQLYHEDPEGLTEKALAERIGALRPVAVFPARELETGQQD